MLKVLRTFALTALLLLPFATQAQTDCTGLTIPYAENFDSYSGNATGTTAPTGYPGITLPDCWSFLNMSSSTSSYPQVFLTSSSTYAVSGKCLFFKSSSSTPLYAVMPAISYAGELQLAFQYRNEGTTDYNGTIIVGIMSDASDANTFVGIDTCVKTTTKTLKEIILPANTLSSGARIAFKYLGGTANNYYAAIDNVVLQVPPTCFQVTDLAVSNPTTTSLTLSWTDALNSNATYTIYNMADTSIAASNVTGTTHTVTGLTPGSIYRFAVMTDCGGGDVTDLTAPVRGITACVSMALPYTTSFEAEELIGTSNTDALPFCWSRYSSGTGSYTYYPYSYSSTSGYAHTGTRVLYFYGGTSTSYPDTMVAIMPPVDVTTFPMNGNRLTFWSRTTAASGSKDVEVGTMSDPTDMSTFTPIQTITVTGTTNTFYAVPLINATATNAYVAFRCLRAGSYLCIDDVTLEELPSCLEVSNLAASDITSSSVTLSWTDTYNTNATYTIISTVTNNVYASNVTGTTYTVTGLNANTLYSFGVRANCSANDSSMVMAVSARTACSSISVPYTTGFEANELVGTTNVDALPFCWTRYSSTATYTYYPYSYSGSTYAHESTRSLYFYGSTSTSYPDTMIAITPAVDVTTFPMNGNRISFWARSSSTSYDKTVFVGTMTDPTDPSTFELVSTVTVTGTTHTLYTVPMLGATATAPYIALMVRRGSGTLYLDDFSIELLPSCVEPANLTATPNGTSAEITWLGSADSYTLTLYDDNNVAIGTPVTVTTNSYTFTGLTLDEDYVVTVVSNCGSDVSGSSSTSFHIGYCLPSPTSVDNSGITNVTFGGMTNTTSHPSASPYYIDNTTIVGSVPAGTTANVDITFATGYTYGTIIWVDWNNSMSFEGNEVVYVGVAGSTNPTVLNATFDIPATTTIGNYRMRIAAADSYFDSYTGSIAAAANASPCFTSTYAIAEDYTLNVTEVPSCMAPTALTAGNITATDAVLTWNGDAASYNVYSVTDTDTTLVQNVTANTITLSGLTAMTQYTYGVRSVCGSDESDIVTVTFNTACAALSLPYTETFESTSSTVNCWSTDGPGTWMIGTGDYNATTGAFEGSSNAKIVHGITGDVTKLISPILDGVNSGMTLDFAYVMRAWASDIDELRVYYRSSAADTWHQAGEYTAAAATWTVESITIPGTVYQIAFEYTDNYGYGLGIDSVVFTAVSSSFCYAVTDLTVSATTSNSVTLSWTDANNSGATYSIFADNGNVVATNVTGTSYTITGLTPATTYTFGVITNCSADNTSNVVTISATTECLSTAINLPFTETFATTSATRNCWTIIDGDGDGFGWSTLLEGTEIEAMTSLSYDNATYNALTPNNWLISPKLHTNAGATITLGWTVESAPSYPAEHYGVYVSTTTTDTNSFTLINEWTLTTGTATPMNVDLSTYAGQDIYIAFRHFNCTDMYVLAIDDINVYEGAYVPDTLTMTFAVNNPVMGTTTPAPGTYQYVEGDTVFFSATPNNGYTFYGWQMAVGSEIDTIEGYQNAYVTANAWMSYGAVTLTAIFEGNGPANDTLNVTFAVNDATMGTTNPVPGTYQYATNDIVYCAAIPNDGYHFVGWIKAAAGDSDTMGVEYITFQFPAYSMIEYGSMTLTALFAPDSTVDENYFTLITAVNDATMGTITPAPGTYNYSIGDMINFSATPNDGYRFDNVHVTLSYMGMPFIDSTFDESILVLVSEPFEVSEELIGYTLSIVVNFARASTEEAVVTVNVNDPEMGYILINDRPTNTYAGHVGETVTIQAIANEGYHFTAWDNGSTNPTLTLTLTGDITVTAGFAANSGIEDVNDININAYSKNGNIVLNGAEGREVYVFDINGRMLHHTATANETEIYNAPVSGVYLIKVDNTTKRVVIIK